MFNTDFVFERGKLSFVMDGGAGSSGKGKLGSFITEHASNWQFAANTFMSNAAHWIVLDDGTKYLYQCLDSCAYSDKYEKMYITGGAVTELEPMLREIKENNITPGRLGIHPLVAIVQKKDIDYERGLCNFDGEPYPNMQQSDCMKLGSTLHGVGAARARRILRRSDVLLARDCPELAPYICWTDREIIDRLRHGQAGIMEIAQGYQLGYLSQFYPKTTSRNCSVAAALDDACIPPVFAGNVVINFRTFPIRVNNNKYVHSETGALLSGPEMDEMRARGESAKIEVLQGHSGACYPDQRETTWEEVTAGSGGSQNIREITSLTRLERRVFTFSPQNLNEAIIGNKTHGETFISVNFMNYVDAAISGIRQSFAGKESFNPNVDLGPKIAAWIENNIKIEIPRAAQLKFLGTGPLTDDMIVL